MLTLQNVLIDMFVATAEAASHGFALQVGLKYFGSVEVWTISW